MCSNEYFLKALFTPNIFHASLTRSGSNRAATKSYFQQDFTTFEPYYNSVRTICEPSTGNLTFHHFALQTDKLLALLCEWDTISKTEYTFAKLNKFVV